MALAAAGSVVFQDYAAETNHQLTVPNVADHDTIVVLFLDRSGTGVIDTVTDSAGGTYTLRSNYSDFGYISEMWVREDAAAAASLVITVTTTGAINSQVYATRIASDAGGTVYPTFDDAAEVAVDGTSHTDTHSNTATATAAGMIVGGIYAGDGQPADPTMDGAGETYGPIDPGAGRHGFMFFESYASAGSYGFEITLASATNTTFHVLAFKESSVTTSYTLTAEQGSYTLTGQVAALLTGGFITAESGSYTLLGSEALVDVEMNADQGSYALSGQTAGLISTALLVAESGTYDLIGQAANLLYSFAASIARPKGQRRLYGFRMNR